ncbi:hypothetical protein WJX84_010819 [Apatococcus fuscideae]|uniref:RBR-type E3 ubiquitin transferase n=1 Tax=Apatococcus fuscideae TaxID=2026836 RepID=A0AAW1TGB7_9CHLO
MVQAHTDDALEDMVCNQITHADVQDNLGQQQEEILGLEAICGINFSSSLGQSTDEDQVEAGGTTSSRGLHLLEASLLVQVDLPENSLKLSVQSQHDQARQAGQPEPPTDSLSYLQHLIGRPSNGCHPSSSLFNAALANPGTSSSHAQAAEASCAAAGLKPPQHGAPVSSAAPPAAAWRAVDGQSAGDVYAAADQLLGHLLRYDAMLEWDRWAQGVWQCGICLEEVAGSKCARLACKHAFCAACMQAHCRLHIKEGSLDHLRCPVPDCKRLLEPEAMADVLTEEEVKRWHDLEEQRIFERSGRAAYCPRCSAKCLEADDGSNCAQCPRCFFAFCTQCQDSWHPASQPCLSPEVALQALKLRMQGMQASASELKQRENDFLSLRAIQKNSKQCPTCKMAIQKASGCSHMVCGSCGTHFCWKCNKSIDGYEHFRSGGCMLFDAKEIRAWEMEMARLTQAQHDREMAMMQNDFWRNNGAAQQRPRPQLCPRCGQPNYKHANNNSITCPSCTCRFCFLCREILQRGTRHFSGTGGCRQHS